MKQLKYILLLLSLVIFTTQPTFAKIYDAKALEDFNTNNPKETFSFEILEDVDLGIITIPASSTFNIKPYKIKNPKRLKQNAGFIMQVTSFTYQNNTHKIKNLYAKYTTELDKLEATKTVALSAGSYFVKGLSIGYKTIEGTIKNEEGNRFKSGAKAAYDATPISFVEKGEAINIKKDEVFSVKFRIVDNNEIDLIDKFMYSIKDEDKETIEKN